MCEDRSKGWHVCNKIITLTHLGNRDSAVIMVALAATFAMVFVHDIITM